MVGKNTICLWYDGTALDAAGRVAVLDVEGLPKLLDWCVLTRRDTPLSAAQRLLRGFVLDQGAAFAACRLG